MAAEITLHGWCQRAAGGAPVVILTPDRDPRAGFIALNGEIVRERAGFDFREAGDTSYLGEVVVDFTQPDRAQWPADPVWQEKKAVELARAHFAQVLKCK